MRSDELVGDDSVGPPVDQGAGGFPFVPPVVRLFPGSQCLDRQSVCIHARARVCMGVCVCACLGVCLSVCVCVCV